MTINRNNYEEFFLGYYEQALDAGMVAELMVFLEANPDLNEAFEAFEPISLMPGKVAFPQKDKLKKKDYRTSGQITPFNYERYMVAGMENDLEEKDLRELKEFLSLNPEARLEYDLFRKTRLIPGPVEYPGKAGLRKRMLPVYRRRVAAVVALAASLLVLLAIYLLKPGEGDGPGLAGTPAPSQVETLPAPDRLPVQAADVPVGTHGSLAGTEPGTSLQDQGLGPARVLPVASPERKAAGLVSIPAARASGLAFMGARDRYRASLEDSPLARTEKEELPFALRFMKGAVGKVFQGGDRPRKSFLEYTVNGYNLMADREVEVEKQYDPSGRLVAYRVNGELIKFGRQVNAPTAD